MSRGIWIWRPQCGRDGRDGTGPKLLPSGPGLLVNNQSRAAEAVEAVKIFIGDPIDLNLLLRSP